MSDMYIYEGRRSLDGERKDRVYIVNKEEAVPSHIYIHEGWSLDGKRRDGAYIVNREEAVPNIKTSNETSGMI